jgi:hypothetical protein
MGLGQPFAQFRRQFRHHGFLLAWFSFAALPDQFCHAHSFATRLISQERSKVFGRQKCHPLSFQCFLSRMHMYMLIHMPSLSNEATGKPTYKPACLRSDSDTAFLNGVRVGLPQA